MEKINKVVKQVGAIIFVVGISVLWFLAMSYTIQHTLFNK